MASIWPCTINILIYFVLDGIKMKRSHAKKIAKKNTKSEYTCQGIHAIFSDIGYQLKEEKVVFFLKSKKIVKAPWIERKSHSPMAKVS